MATAAPRDIELERFSRDITDLNARPLWERTVRMRPGSPAVPTIWRYEEMRPQLMRACGLITTHQADRRVLMLENPGLPGTSYITSSLFAGLQVILPGEIAASHRHSPNALRFIVEGTGAYTSVSGERVMMSPGDFIVTPSWAWHDHGNIGNEPVIWLDALDTAFLQLFGAMFREDYPQDIYPVERQDGDALARYGTAMLPVDQKGDGRASPLLRYPYERTRAALERLSLDGGPHAVNGYKLRYANPSTGGHAFATMAVALQLLPRDFAGACYRSTDGTVFKVVEGEGSARIEDEVFAFTQHDVFVVPPWCAYSLAASSECVLFSYSDRAAQEALGFWREERL